AFDEFGGMAGIVTVEDIVEEIVGEIWDEHEKAEEPVKSSADGSWIVKGRAAVEELAEETGIEIPDQDLYETVGGMVMTLAGKVPLKGDRVSFAGFEFEVLDRTRTRVICLSVRKVPDAGQDPDEQD
ncbi:MAG TPA: transporter associated domain-containing protein, partial [Myxococcota bacterium]|nr:transporter associated domain-containing protein [Myxococcota bacterium]